MDINTYFARKDSNKNENKSKNTIVIIGLIIISILLIITWVENSNKNKALNEEKQRQEYKKTIVKVSHEIKSGETVYFEFGKMLKRHKMKIHDKENKKGVILNFKFFPSDDTGTYTDENPELNAGEFTDTGVYVTSSEIITLELSLL